MFLRYFIQRSGNMRQKCPSKKEMLRDTKELARQLDKCVAANLELKIVNERNANNINKANKDIDLFNRFLDTYSLINSQWIKFKEEYEDTSQ